MANNTQALSVVCDVEINISPVAASAPTFNQGLIIGTSAVIPSSGSTGRLRRYTSLAGLTADGFTTVQAEYLAAQLYFSQTPTPQYVWIGRQDTTAIATATFTAGGTGYTVGDVLTVTQAGASGGQVRVTTVSAGVVTGVAVVSGSQGTAYSIASGLATTGGTGTGATINITAIGETPLQAVTACRLASSAWWGCMVCTAVAADHTAIAAYMNAVLPKSCYFFTTADTQVLNGTAGNVFLTLQAAQYNRAIGIYSTTQAGAFPNNAYAAAAVLGTAMGLNTGLANSYFTLKFKVLSGVAAEMLTSSQVASIEAANGNVYLNYANTYNWLEPGIMPNGQFFDEILALDMLASDIQYSCINLLISQPSIPQSNAGQSQLLTTVSGACDRSVARGFLSPGIWQGQTVLGLIPGTPLPRGYICQSPAQSTQSTADRQARKALPIYVALTEAGAMHSITVGCYVQR